MSIVEKMYKKNGESYRFRVVSDHRVKNPRLWNSNVGYMVIENRPKDEIEAEKDKEHLHMFLNDLIVQYIGPEKFLSCIEGGYNGLDIRYVKDAKTGTLRCWNGYLQIQPSTDAMGWELWGKACKNNHRDSTSEACLIKKSKKKEYLMQTIFKHLTIMDKWRILAAYGDVVYVRICDQNTRKLQKDKQYTGWIWTNKQTVMEKEHVYTDINGNTVVLTDENWKNAAKEWLNEEIWTYEMYLYGNVYGYEVCKENGNGWEMINSGHGIYSDLYGEDLLRYVAEESGYSDMIF